MKIPSGTLDLLAIGETLIDFISVEEADLLLDAHTFRKYLGGSPANIAIYVAKLGGRAAIVSKTGIGAMGQFVRAELGRAGVVTDYLVMDARVHTSIIFVTRTARTPDFEPYRNGDYKLEPTELDLTALRQARVIHASTWALSREPCRSAIQKAFEIGRSEGKIISLDPNYSPAVWPEPEEAMAVIARMLRYAHITKPSLDDATRLFGPGRRPEEYIERFHSMGPEVVVFTMGADGLLLSAGGRLTHIPGRPVKVVDATGAGDSFWAGFLVALLDGNSLERSALFARQVVERKLTTVGPLPGGIDRNELYAAADAAWREPGSPPQLS
jgi:sugar/nucleoside kinase (ribokinase family)